MEDENYEVGSGDENYEVGSDDDEKFGLEKVWNIKAHQFGIPSSRIYELGSDDEHFGLRKVWNIYQYPSIWDLLKSILLLFKFHISVASIEFQNYMLAIILVSGQISHGFCCRNFSTGNCGPTPSGAQFSLQ